MKKNSPAEEAQLKEGDEILSIDFKPFQNLSLEAIETLFHSRNNRSILLEILPENSQKSERVILTLKRMI